MNAVGCFCLAMRPWSRLNCKRTLDFLRPSISSGSLRCKHDLQNMVRMFWSDERVLLLSNAVDEVWQSSCPSPLRIGFVIRLPSANTVLPKFVAFRTPVVAEHLNGAFGSIQFQSRRAILLHGEPRGDRRENGIAKVQDNLGIVFYFDANLLSVHDTFRLRCSSHSHDALGR